MGTPKLDYLNSNIQFFTSLDSLRKIRVEYILPFNTSHRFFNKFDAEEVKVDHFSQIIKSAHDHITFFQGNIWYLTAAVGLNNIKVTYLKTNNNFNETRENFEKHLENHCHIYSLEV